MAHCEKCGVEIFSGDKFCHACGAEIDQTAILSEGESPSLKQSGSAGVSDQKEGKKPKRKKNILLIVLGVPVVLIVLFLIFIIVDSGIFQSNIISIGRDADASHVQDSAGQAEAEPELQVGPTLTAFAMQNQMNSVETAEPQADLSGNEPVLIYSEDFDNDTGSAIPILSTEYMSFSTISGEGFLSSSYGTGIFPIVFPDLSVTDFIVEFDCLAPEGYEDSVFGLIFRADEAYEDGLHSYYALFIFPQQNAYRMGLWIDEEWYKTDIAQFNSLFDTDYAMNRVRLEVLGTEMKLYLNGEFESGFSNDDKVESGLLGFFISPSADLPEGRVDAVFLDNFKVYQP